MANRNFNKQIVPARKKLAAGGTLSPRKPLPRFKKKDTTDREQIIRDRIGDKERKLGPSKPRPMPILPKDPRDKMEPRPMPTMPIKPKNPRDKMEPRKPMPKLPGRPKPPIRGLTPEQIKRLKELMKKRRGLDPKNPKFKKSIDSLKELMKKTGRPKGRKKLMGGGSSSSREAMMHGFYNKDMGMGKKKK